MLIRSACFCVLLSLGSGFCQQTQTINGLTFDSSEIVKHVEQIKATYLHTRDSMLSFAASNTSKMAQQKAYQMLMSMILNKTFEDLGSKDFRHLLKADVKNFYDSMRVISREMWGDSMLAFVKGTIQVKIMQDSIDTIKAIYDRKLSACKSLKLYGDVTSIDGRSVSLFGAAYNSKCSYIGNCDDEGIPGQLYTPSNIVALNYSDDHRVEGREIIGDRLMLTGYSYSHKTSGTNAFGASVPAYVYTPVKCVPPAANRDKLVAFWADKQKVLCQHLGFDSFEEFIGFCQFMNTFKEKAMAF